MKKKVRFNEVKLTDNQLLMISDALSTHLQVIWDDIAWCGATQRDADICQSAARRIAKVRDAKGIHKKNGARNITK